MPAHNLPVLAELVVQHPEDTAHLVSTRLMEQLHLLHSIEPKENDKRPTPTSKYELEATDHHGGVSTKGKDDHAASKNGGDRHQRYPLRDRGPWAVPHL